MLAKKLLLNKTVLRNSNLQLVRNAAAFKFMPDTAPPNLGETTKMNLCQAVTNALDLTLSTDKSAGKKIKLTERFRLIGNKSNLNFYCFVSSYFRRRRCLWRSFPLHSWLERQIRQGSCVQYSTRWARYCRIRHRLGCCWCHCCRWNSIRWLHFPCIRPGKPNLINALWKLTRTKVLTFKTQTNNR